MANNTTLPTEKSKETAVIELHERSDNPWIEAGRNLLRNRSARAGLVIIGFLVFVMIFAPVLATHDPLLSMIGIDGEVPPLPRKAPCIPLLGCEEPMHILGLDLNARDLYSRIVWGTRQSLPVGFIAVSISITVGTFLGLVAGYASGWLDNLIMRIMDVVLAFPALLLAIAIVTILGPGLINALIAISIVAIPSYARIARASTISLKELEFITAERALGANPSRILFTQILPNALTPLIVQGTLGIGTAVLDAAALSFLGLGAQPPTPEWGQILSESRNYVFTSPHMVFFPGFAIMLTVLGFNLLGDGMRDALDPRLNRN
ncbi:MAG: ABC transporter permease [Anaerolineae bacterium]|nr:ABC transporter permease [Anaerolineae bacterium]